eukprot:6188184-Pleurochrysis_carterae.AAC.4
MPSGVLYVFHCEPHACASAAVSETSEVMTGGILDGFGQQSGALEPPFTSLARSGARATVFLSCGKPFAKSPPGARASAAARSLTLLPSLVVEGCASKGSELGA